MEKIRTDSISTSEGEDESPGTPLHQELETDIKSDGVQSNNNLADNGDPVRIEEKPVKKKWINGHLLALKTLLFIFYGGIGLLSTWLNHSQLSKRFNEKETALVYGLSSLLSIATPFIFGFISDKTAQPKRVLAVALLLGGLIYPLILIVPSAVSYHYKEKLDWCRNSGRNESACLPFQFLCDPLGSELITNPDGVCSEGCNGKLIIKKCQYQCGADRGRTAFHGGKKNNTTKDFDDYDLEKPKIVASSLASPDPDYNYDSNLIGSVDLEDYPPPHVCFNLYPKERYRPLCHVFHEDVTSISIDVQDISGIVHPEDEKCHYPLGEYVENTKEFNPLISCSQYVNSSKEHDCNVICSLQWDHNENDQWVCRDDYYQWLISFSVFLIAHTFGTMLLITSAGLLNAAVLSMAHEHEHGGYFGFQIIFGGLGYTIIPPLVAFLFQLLQDSNNLPLPWHLEYIILYSVWFLISGLLACFLSYNAEWVPKPNTVRSMLVRWFIRGQTILFFKLLIILGCFQGMIDVLGYYQVRSIGGSLLTVGIGAAASVAPALVFLIRVERVIEYCGQQNILAIALVSFALQFTGYAYLENAAAEWSFLLRAMDTFSVVLVWITASFTTYNSAPRSLVATCQCVIATLYCCIGRGLGGVLAYAGLLHLPKEYVFKTLAVLAILLAGLFVMLYHFCFKPTPFTKKYNMETPVPQGQSRKYKPLRLIGKKDLEEGKEMDEL